MTRQFVEEITGSCDFIEGDPAAAAKELVKRLRDERVIE